MYTKIFLFLFFPSILLAAGGEGHGSPQDLIFPAMNFSIFALGLVCILRKPLKNFFIQKSRTVRETIERVDAKAKEASQKLEHHKRKMQNLDAEIREIRTEAEKSIESFKKSYQVETQEKVEKLKTDNLARLEAEKKSMADGLVSEMVDQVVVLVRNQVLEDQSLRQKVSGRFSKELRQ